MPTFDFNFGLSALVNGAIQAIIILLIALVLVMIARRGIPKLIGARIPKIRIDSWEVL
jgi:hypothetical protein